CARDPNSAITTVSLDYW
nr:immunoglobulin heavy chain junction region [Macaca mulatta]